MTVPPPLVWLPSAAKRKICRPRGAGRLQRLGTGHGAGDRDLPPAAGQRADGGRYAADRQRAGVCTDGISQLLQRVSRPGHLRGAVFVGVCGGVVAASALQAHLKIGYNAQNHLWLVGALGDFFLFRIIFRLQFQRK